VGVGGERKEKGLVEAETLEEEGKEFKKTEKSNLFLPESQTIN